MNIRVSSASLGLQGLIWSAFTVATSAAAFVKIAPPSFTVDKITTALGAASAGLSKVVLTVASAGILPAWAVPGAAVNVNVTKGGVPLVFGAVVKDIAANGTTITFAMSAIGGQSLSTAFTNASLDAIAGAVVNTVTLNIQCQKAMFSLPSTAANNVNIAPAADANGANAPYSATLTPGSEYEVTAPFGSKFDLADWWVQSAGGTPSLTIRFL